MKTKTQRSETAYRATLAHASYASIESNASIEEKIAELGKGLRILCEEYGVDFDADTKLDD